MELEELKNRWSALEEQLNKQELLHVKMMREFLYTQSDKNVSRLLGLEVGGLVAPLLGFPVIIYALGRSGQASEYYLFLYGILIGVCLPGVFCQLFKLYDLIRIDFSKTLNNNIRYTNKYNIKIRKEKITMLFLTPVLFLSCVYIYAKSHVHVWQWAFLFFCMSVAALLSFWGYKKICKNIRSILKSLEELRDLEEERENGL
jgi:hypothetical protein